MERQTAGLSPKYLMFSAAFFAVVAAPTESRAQEYPWCAQYSWSTYNCGFFDLQQCLATIDGVGGVCKRNPRYVPQRRSR